MIYIRRGGKYGFTLKHPWMLEVIPTRKQFGFEAGIKLSPYYRIYVRLTWSQFLGTRFVFEPAWIEFSTTRDVDPWDGWAAPPRPDAFSLLVRYVWPGLRRTIAKYESYWRGY